MSPQLLVCRDLRDIGLLELGAPAPDILLLGWSGPPQVDAGLPGWLLGPLSIALAASGPVGFFSGDAGPDATEVAAPWMRRVAALLGHAAPLYFRVTTAPKTVAAAFDAPNASWDMQAQILLGISGPPPALSMAEAEALVSDTWLAAVRRKSGIRWALRPAVDGAAAGFWSSEPDIGADLLDRIRGTGVSVNEVDPDSFRCPT